MAYYNPDRGKPRPEDVHALGIVLILVAKIQSMLK